MKDSHPVVYLSIRPLSGMENLLTSRLLAVSRVYFFFIILAMIEPSVKRQQ
jgi:hypothetical protein